MQESFWWWQCSNGYITSIFPHRHSPIPKKLYGFCGRKAPWKRKNHQRIILTHTCAWSSRITPSYCRFCAAASCCRRHSSCRAVAALCSAFSWAAATSSRKLCQGRICAQQGWACVFSLLSTLPVCSYTATCTKMKTKHKEHRRLESQWCRARALDRRHHDSWLSMVTKQVGGHYALCFCAHPEISLGSKSVQTLQKFC